MGGMGVAGLTTHIIVPRICRGYFPALHLDILPQIFSSSMCKGVCMLCHNPVMTQMVSAVRLFIRLPSLGASRVLGPELKLLADPKFSFLDNLSVQ